MRNLLVRLLRYLTKNEKQEVIKEPKQEKEDQSTLREDKKEEIKIIVLEQSVEEEKPARKSKKKASNLTKVSIDPRDIMETMGIPYLALSKNRTAPIIYESPDGTTKVKISRHSEHYIASIYDWDII